MRRVAEGAVEKDAFEIDLQAEQVEQFAVEAAGGDQLVAHQKDGLDVTFAVEPGGGKATEILAVVEHQFIHLAQGGPALGIRLPAVAVRQIEHERAVGVRSETEFRVAVQRVLGWILLLYSASWYFSGTGPEHQ